MSSKALLKSKLYEAEHALLLLQRIEIYVSIDPSLLLNLHSMMQNVCKEAENPSPRRKTEQEA